MWWEVLRNTSTQDECETCNGPCLLEVEVVVEVEVEVVVEVEVEPGC